MRLELTNSVILKFVIMKTKSETKNYSWKKFQESQAWKIFFITIDSLIRVVTYPVFFVFVSLFMDHNASTKSEFYGPMIVLFVVCLLIPWAWISKLSFCDILLIDLLIAVILVLSVFYPFWSEYYREKHGYESQWFG